MKSSANDQDGKEDVPTPASMLKLYRQSSPTFDNEQAQMFRSMPVDDQLELIFYMIMNTNKIVQYIHGMISPEEAVTRGMPQAEKAN